VTETESVKAKKQGRCSAVIGLLHWSRGKCFLFIYYFL